MSARNDYFTLFDLPRQYLVDKAALEAAYERLTLETHPDFLAGADDAEKKAALKISAQLNEAYRVLSSGRERAAYLLSLLANGTQMDTKTLPPGFLQEMFFLQEAVEALGQEDDEAEKAPLRSQTRERLEAIENERQTLFEQAQQTKEAALYQAIQSNINCERYLLRLIESLDGKEML